MELRNAPFLEASRRSLKEGGARSQEEYKGAQDAKSWSSCWCLRGGVFVVVSSGGLLLLRSLWWFLLVVFLVGIFGSWWPVCGEAVRGKTRSSELAVGGESGRGTRDADWRRRSTGCVARTCASVCRALERARRPRGRPESAAAILAAVATDVATRPSRHLEGAGNLQRSRGALSVTQAPRHKGLRTLSASLVFEGSLFFSFE